jgi:CheY-like chemotaxis protein
VPARVENTVLLIAVDDMLFASKIRQAARAAGATFTVVRSGDEAIRQAATGKPRVAIFDLDSPRIDAVRALTSLRAIPECETVRAIGFLSHVHVERAAAAQAAGFDEVLARSAFVTRLPELLSGVGR